ncbi:hypothetical protein ACWCPQ_03260 [Nocardia sp. NPDC001965]
MGRFAADVLEPLFGKYREDRNAPELWDDFEWLARPAIEIKRPVNT